MDIEINTSNSGVESDLGKKELQQLVEEGLAKVNPQYVELFKKTQGTIDIEGIIDEEENTMGLSRYPHGIAIKTSLVSTDMLDKVLSEEIIHYLDCYLRFSETSAFNMQQAANTDAENPLSLAMLAVARGGTKNMGGIEDAFNTPDPMSMMAEFSKTLPFLGGYHDAQNMDKYEWLTEVEHAERALCDIKENEQADLLSARAQQNIPLVLMLRFLSNHGLDVTVEAKKMANGEITAAESKDKIARIVQQYDLDGWLNKLAGKVDISHVNIDGGAPNNPLDKIKAAIFSNLAMDQNYPLSDEGLKKLMIAMFPESYYALKSFRDEVDRSLIDENRHDEVTKALEQDNIRKYLTSSTMDEVALKKLYERLQRSSPDESKAIENTVLIHGLIKAYKRGTDEPVAQVKKLLEKAWPDTLIDSKTIMALAVDKEMYEVAAAIRDAFNAKTKSRQSPPPP